MTDDCCYYGIENRMICSWRGMCVHYKNMSPHRERDQGYMLHHLCIQCALCSNLVLPEKFMLSCILHNHETDRNTELQCATSAYHDSSTPDLSQHQFEGFKWGSFSFNMQSLYEGLV